MATNLRAVCGGLALLGLTLASVSAIDATPVPPRSLTLFDAALASAVANLSTRIASRPESRRHCRHTG